MTSKPQRQTLTGAPHAVVAVAAASAGNPPPVVAASPPPTAEQPAEEFSSRGAGDHAQLRTEEKQ